MFPPQPASARASTTAAARRTNAESIAPMALRNGCCSISTSTLVCGADDRYCILRNQPEKASLVAEARRSEETRESGFFVYYRRMPFTQNSSCRATVSPGCVTNHGVERNAVHASDHTDTHCDCRAHRRLPGPDARSDDRQRVGRLARGATDKRRAPGRRPGARSRSRLTSRSARIGAGRLACR